MPNTPTKPPIPAPPAFYRYQFESHYGPVWRSSAERWNGQDPTASEPLYTADQMLAYAEALAAERVREERERVVDIVLIELDCNGQAGAIVQAIRARKE